jgi:hypothetical protein
LRRGFFYLVGATVAALLAISLPRSSFAQPASSSVSAAVEPTIATLLQTQQEARAYEREINDRVKGLRQAQVKQTRLTAWGFAVLLAAIVTVGIVLGRRKSASPGIAASPSARGPLIDFKGPLIDLSVLRDWEERRLLRKIARSQAQLRLALQELDGYIEETGVRKDQFGELVAEARRQLDRLDSERAAATRR